MIKTKSISELNIICKSIIANWGCNNNDFLFNDLYNKLHALIPDVKKELQELDVNFIQTPDYIILVQNISEIQSLFMNTHKHQFVFHLANTLKEDIDLAIAPKSGYKPPNSTFIEYLIHPKRELLAQKLKEKFLDLTGQNEPALCYCLVDNGLLDTKELDRTKIHRLFKDYFKNTGVIEQAKNIISYLDEYYKIEKSMKSKKLDSKIKGFNETIVLILSTIK